ncbi:endonuclease/exonuclease/phosphatase family protein [Flavivirga sp. 57AJ16]|uniref:endonuclease/exonuclease/phosphatase family protein n=1 Tax=Flavivirga sp. 57AJ16 TaxID=3025307 RepID=UPI0023659707|nr:endonuclease/exonuclease/phosphatase family protein [Flavivirga sp. 57AJ16]MDD7884794.1 endonuclease/exonuclease/phosphatase family protein [Flavivirga sp. 57AJ16]
MLKFIKALFNVINVIIIIALLAIHFVAKESSYQASLYFYTFPLPIIILIVLVLSVFIGRRFRKYNLLLGTLLLVIWLGRSFKIHIPEDIKENDLEVVFWNASHERNFQDVFNENDAIPDVVVLVEYHGDILKKTKLKYLDYYFYKHPVKEIGVFSKTPINIKKVMPSKYKSTVINFETNGVNFYAVDVSGSMDVPRSWELEFVTEAITQTKNTVVLGDFNVPFESMYLDKIKMNFNHAFSEKGNGFRETWFWNIPLLSLDHIWVSKDLETLKAVKIGTFKSDHSMIKAVVGK